MGGGRSHGGDGGSGGGHTELPPVPFRVVVCLLVVLVIFGARAWTVHVFGSQMPYWDQWGGESELLLSHRDGTLTAGDLVRAHNEHRILFSRLFWLSVFVANDGQWDNLPTLYGMAALAAFWGGLAVWLALRASRWRYPAVVVLAGVLLFSLPLGWLNTVWGFQVQFHAQLLFALVALYGLGVGRAFSAAWWAGVVAAVFGLFTSGAGMLAGATVAFFAAMGMWRKRGAERGDMATLVVGLLVVVAGMLLLEPGAEAGRFRAGTPGEFLVAAFRNFAWPWVDAPWMAVWVYLPAFGLLLCWLFLPGGGVWRGGCFPLLLAAYASAQFLAIAYSRGVNGLEPHFRYYEFHMLGVFAGFPCVAELLSRASAAWRAPMRGAAVAWMAVVLAGVGSLAFRHLTVHLPEWRGHAMVQAENLNAYLGDGDVSHLRGKPRLAIPVGRHEQLVHALSRPGLREILPSLLRPAKRWEAREWEGSFRVDVAEPAAGECPQGGGVLTCHVAEGGEGVFRSGEFDPPFSHLLWWHAGYSTGGSLEVALVGDGGALRHDVVTPLAEDGGRGWRRVVAKSPAGLIHLEASDRRPGGWFAMSGAVSVGTLTAWALRYGGWAQRLLFASAGLLVALFLAMPMGMGGREEEMEK